MLSVLFAAVWILVGFVAVRFAGQQFLHEKYRADIVAIAIVLAFAIGALWRPFSTGTGSAAAPGPAVPGPVARTVCYRSGEIKRNETVIRHIKLATGGNYGGNLDSLTADPGGPPALEFPAGCNIYANGWAANMATKTPASGIVLVVDSRDVVNASSVYRKPRTDVAKAYGADSMLRTGFADAVIPTTGLAKGRHTIQLGGLSNNGRWYYLIGAPTTITLR